MNHKLFITNIYHPTLFIINLFRYPLKSFDLLYRVINQNIFSLYGFRIKSPKSIDKYFFANLNTKFSSFILQRYEEDEKALIENYLEKNDVVLELGGCIGVISSIINSKLENKENHLVLEIDPRKFNFLKINKKINNSGFKLFNGVLSNKKGLFYESSTNFLSGSLTENETELPVESSSLKKLEMNYNLKFNVLVMDIEGGEVEVIEETDLGSFNKLIFEIHFNREDLKYKKIEEILYINKFNRRKIEGNVEFWSR